MFLVNPTQEPTIMETTGKPLTLGRRTDRMQPQQPPARASLGSVTGEARPSVHRGSRPVTEAPVFQVGSCQNYGPFLGTLNNRCRIILRTQKGTLILTTTQVDAVCLSAFPKQLVDFQTGIFFAKWSAASSPTPPDPTKGAFLSLVISREPRLPRALRDRGHEVAGYCFSLCPPREPNIP